MKNVFLTAVFLFATTFFLQAQGTIKGNVVDTALNNEPILFANVQLKGTNISQQTNFHGNFEFSEITPGKYIVMISYTGYETKEIAVVVKDNTINKVEAGLAPITINFEDVSGLETIVTKNENVVSFVEKE